MGANRTGEGRVGRGITDAVYVDVDGTLLLWPTKVGSPTPEETAAARRMISGDAYEHGKPREGDEHLCPTINVALVARLKAWYAEREAAGASPLIVIWTMGGRQHAELAMMLCDFDMGYCVDCLPKPDVMVDDAGALLMRKHPVVTPEAFML